MTFPTTPLLLASSASRPLTVVQAGVISVARSGSGSVSQPLAANITLPSGYSNALLVAMVLAPHDIAASTISANWDAAGTPVAMTKTLSDIYTTANSGAANGSVFWLANPAANGTAKSFSVAGTAGFWNIAVGYLYVTGANLVSPLEGVTGSANATSSATASISVTHTTARAIRFFGTSFQGHDGYDAVVPNPTTPTGYTLIGRGQTATNSLTTDATYGFWYKQVSAAGTETISTTFKVSDGRGILAGVIK